MKISIKLSILGILTSLAFLCGATAQETSPNMFLNKISNRLVGSWPYPSEYEALQKEMKSKNCNSVTCLDGFFRSYIRAKMDRAEFYAMFYGEVTERFGYKTPSSSRLSEIIQQGKKAMNASNGRDFALVYRILKDNLSFDELFTSQIITDPVYPDVSASNGGAFNFMGIDTSKLPISASQATPYNILLENGQTLIASQFNLKDHANISGLFSSMTFLARYWNGERNENRKRAAAYFRVMLCDSMSPALERESEKEKERRLALGKTDEQLIVEEVKAAHAANKHGTQKDCAMCHSRLEPVGTTMFAMEQGISGESFEAMAKFTNSMSEQVDVKVKNFHDLIVKTTQQAKYVDCQTSWLIEAMLGKDLNLSPVRLTEIINGVENKKRRLKSVIEDLLMIPELRGIKTEKAEPTSLIAAKAVLSNCTECHSNTFKLRPEQMKARLSRVAVCLDLPNEGKDAQMPPSDHYWQPTTTEILAVKTWLNQGAPLDENIKLFEKSEVEQLFSRSKEVKKCRQ